MAPIFDAGHEETEKDLPRPLQSGWYPGVWALPATTLSAASLVVLLTVIGFLQTSETSRSLFRLPFASGWPALAGAVLAWAVALRCRKRPGRHLPRYWALFLATGTSALTLLGFLGSDLARSPLVHACALASLAASFTLLPRLLPLQPDQRLVQHIAPLALAFALFLALFASCFIGGKAVQGQKQRVGETIAELSGEAGEVREVSAFPWSSSAERREDALRQIQRLQALPLEQWIPDRYLWQGAAHLGEDEQLAAAYRELLDAVVAGMDLAHTPKLWQPQFLWDHDTQRWTRDTAFPDLSAAVAGYHVRTRQIFERLAPPSGDSPVLRDLATFYDQKKQEVDGRLAALAKTWNEDWIPPLVSSPRPETGQSPSPLAELLRRPLPSDGELRPASLARLLDLPLEQAERVADPERGCGQRPYQEDDFQYFRIDCYAYVAHPAAERPSADLRIEMRIVYKSETGKPLSRKALPSEIYFILPVPTGTNRDKYRDDVMQAFADAVRAEHQGSALKMIDRSGLPAKGFTFETGYRRRILRVTSHLISDLSGGVPGIGVRATYRDLSS
jgi:hypothetical protein